MVVFGGGETVSVLGGLTSFKTFSAIGGIPYSEFSNGGTAAAGVF